MVGIVVVSHNRRLADEVIRLSKEMQMCEFKIVNGGGIDLDGEQIGTNPMLMFEAIQAADEGDGVLVLVDLGSALMNYDVVLELNQDVHTIALADAPLVEGCITAVASNYAGITLTALLEETNKAKYMDKKR